MALTQAEALSGWVYTVYRVYADSVHFIDLRRGVIWHQLRAFASEGMSVLQTWAQCCGECVAANAVAFDWIGKCQIKRMG